MSPDDIRILRLNAYGQPQDWLRWEEAVVLQVRGAVSWTMGEEILTVHGGYNRITERRSSVTLNSIVACGHHGEKHAGTDLKRIPPLTNRALFKRDQNLCLYCGRSFSDRDLTRDHVMPISRGGKDLWRNVVAACRRCNQHKSNRLLNECSMELLALPYTPNYFEYLAIVNHHRILGDQMEFLKAHFPKNSRLL